MRAIPSTAQTIPIILNPFFYVLYKIALPFSELETLQEDTEAKSIVRQYRSCCSTIPFAEGAID
jgi:hypothetical protein